MIDWIDMPTMNDQVTTRIVRIRTFSVPPTARVDTPSCRTSGGSVREPKTEAFADALLDGGPGCLVRVAQQLSGLRIDHYLALDLGRLPGMVKALGGISVCVPSSPAAPANRRPL